MSMQAQELKTQIDLHATWLRTNGAEGVRAVLRGADLTGAVLRTPRGAAVKRLAGYALLFVVAVVCCVAVGIVECREEGS